jgi:hypothetical protein
VYLAGNAVYGIATTFKVAVLEVIEIVWEIISAFNKYPGLTTSCTKNTIKQKAIAAALKKNLL